MMRHQWSKQKSLTSTHRQSSPSSWINIQYLNTLEKSNRCRDLRGRIDKQSEEVQKLRITVAMQTNGVELEQDLLSDLKGITNKITEKVHEEHPDGFQHVILGPTAGSLGNQ